MISNSAGAMILTCFKFSKLSD